MQNTPSGVILGTDLRSNWINAYLEVVDAFERYKQEVGQHVGLRYDWTPTPAERLLLTVYMTKKSAEDLLLSKYISSLENQPTNTEVKKTMLSSKTQEDWDRLMPLLGIRRKPDFEPEDYY